MNWCFLFAIVDDDKNGVDEITGKADVGQRNPQAEGQEPVNEPWRVRERERRKQAERERVVERKSELKERQIIIFNNVSLICKYSRGLVVHRSSQYFFLPP